MSRLEKLIHNPHNYKNLCDVFEAHAEECRGCIWNKTGYICSIPLYERAEVMGVLRDVTSYEIPNNH